MSEATQAPTKVWVIMEVQITTIMATITMETEVTMANLTMEVATRWEVVEDTPTNN